MVVKYCKQPFEDGMQFGCISRREGRVLFEDSYKPGYHSPTFSHCGVWLNFEIGTEDRLLFYVCRDCLLKQGLLW